MLDAGSVKLKIEDKRQGRKRYKAAMLDIEVVVVSTEKLSKKL
jgi:hypothetical protein